MNENRVEPIVYIPGYNQQGTNVQNYQSTQVVIIQPGPAYPLLGRDPTTMTCPKCKSSVVTRIEYKNGTYTYILCLMLSFTGGCLGCQFIPFCLECAKDVNHFCPNCGELIGTVERMQRAQYGYSNRSRSMVVAMGR
ncbi:unnamed protein product [Brachionus calyciflorus]|uniref:LITAF domain-containing protein n=1 Tax=Brachionus calyciflorus TaxID=104777 RepID=A0A813QC78_9BILA|nr:unnamed protein product [Brachionus calyciflorus]